MYDIICKRKETNTEDKLVFIIDELSYTLMKLYKEDDLEEYNKVKELLNRISNEGKKLG